MKNLKELYKKIETFINPYLVKLSLKKTGFQGKIDKKGKPANSQELSFVKTGIFIIIAIFAIYLSFKLLIVLIPLIYFLFIFALIFSFIHFIFESLCINPMIKLKLEIFKNYMFISIIAFISLPIILIFFFAKYLWGQIK